ncbi:hypothetical protein GLE_2742 [Lysobacter enzymogenes]|uniref:Uncharacterized protein n=1 Tax=Lysobacter enzymogenes TaxID=69 RepID=A0A0S2DHS9_LYSEN|nr:hypothetical protein GLE_2742 [Lysobacter enzymogenes]
MDGGRVRGRLSLLVHPLPRSPRRRARTSCPGCARVAGLRCGYRVDA